MAERIIAHLLECSAEYKRRALRPRVAWDCLGAETWAGICKQLAGRVWGMDEATALRTLIAIRDGDYSSMQGSEGAIGWYASMDMWTQMAEIVDPIAMEQVGYIVLRESRASGNLKGPPEQQEAYCRYLGTNLYMDGLRRGRSDGTTFGWVLDESDEAWAARKQAWFARYHPGILIREDRERWDSGASYTRVISSVGDFLAANCILPADVVHWLPAYPEVA